MRFSIVKAKTTPGVTDAIYNAWYTEVYESASEVAGA